MPGPHYVPPPEDERTEAEKLMEEDARAEARESLDELAKQIEEAEGEEPVDLVARVKETLEKRQREAIEGGALIGPGAERAERDHAARLERGEQLAKNLAEKRAVDGRQVGEEWKAREFEKVTARREQRGAVIHVAHEMLTNLLQLPEGWHVVDILPCPLEMNPLEHPGRVVVVSPELPRNEPGSALPVIAPAYRARVVRPLDDLGNDRSDRVAPELIEIPGYWPKP